MEQREIKFRAWDENFRGGTMREFSLGETLVSDKDRTIDFNSLPVMQYTGLPDKDGKEIYKSDIVECDYGRGEVVWMLGAWMIRWIDDKEADMEFLGLNKKGRRAREDGERFAVIGNIHQNPELLTQ